MLRQRAITLRDLDGRLDVLFVECDKCGRFSRYQLDHLIERCGIDAKLASLSQQAPALARRQRLRMGYPSWEPGYGGYRDAHRPRRPSDGGEALITRCKARGLAERMIGNRLNAAVKRRDARPRLFQTLAGKAPAPPTRIKKSRRVIRPLRQRRHRMTRQLRQCGRSDWPSRVCAMPVVFVPP
jgi:hypothetical protein